MTLEQMKNLLGDLSNVTNWSIQLIKFKNTSSNTSTYFCRNITLSPNGKLGEIVAKISSTYTNVSKNKLNEYRAIEEYNGTTDSQIIYTISMNNPLVADEYSSLINSISTPDNEVDTFEMKANAYLIHGSIRSVENGEEVDKPIKLISMQSPITNLKNKFLSANGTFKEITDKVLNLRPIFDVLIYDDTIYMFTLAGEKLFNMERAYKSVCVNKIAEVIGCDFITDNESFSNIALTGHNPRRFISFNQNRLEQLKDNSKRIVLANKFEIPLNNDKFDTTQEGSSDKLIKLLCNKGMLDPFDDVPVEVSNAKSWS